MTKSNTLGRCKIDKTGFPFLSTEGSGNSRVKTISALRLPHCSLRTMTVDITSIEAAILAQLGRASTIDDSAVFASTHQ